MAMWYDNGLASVGADGFDFVMSLARIGSDVQSITTKVSDVKSLAVIASHRQQLAILVSIVQSFIIISSNL